MPGLSHSTHAYGRLADNHAVIDDGSDVRGDEADTPLLDEPPTRINSVVLRHERTLEHRIVRAMALKDDDGSVSLVIHKHEAG